MSISDSFTVRWYGERGIINALVGHIQQSTAALERVKALIGAIHWADRQQPIWTQSIDLVTVIVEIGLADFGNPDIILIVQENGRQRCIFIEAKVCPYLLSMRPNNVGMQEPGFNSSINGQLALKYRFAKALERSAPDSAVVAESNLIFQAYSHRVHDSRRIPRNLAKREIVRDILAPLGLLNLPEEQCHYVALTWDTEPRAFIRDELIGKEDGLPCLLDEHGRDMYPTMRGRVGWLGYQLLDRALDLSEKAEYSMALRTMLSAPEPNDQDYSTAEMVVKGSASALSLALVERLGKLLARYKPVRYKGSYSVMHCGQTIGKIIPRRDSVFVGVRGTTVPAAWASWTAETQSVQGVAFSGISIRADIPDSEDLTFLLKGFEL